MPDAVQSRRLVVLVPDQQVDEIQFSRAIRTLALERYLDVLLVTVAGNSNNELALRRRIATIASLVRDFQFEAETLISAEKKWIKALTGVCQPDDMVVCPSELTISTGFGRRQGLGDAIQAALRLPIYPLAGFFHEDTRRSRVVAFLAYWTVLLVIFAIFFGLEDLTNLVVTGWLGHLLTLLLLCVEVGAIYLWTAITG